MYPRFRSFVTVFTFMALLFAAPTLAAQETTTETEPNAFNQQNDEIDDPFSAGNFDLTFSAGMTNWAYVYVEPGLDIGVLNIGDGLSLSIGGMLNAGYCVTCLLSRLIPGFDLNSWYASPKLRTAVHFNLIAQALNLENLDVYAGVMAGPSLYSLTLRTDGVSGDANVTSLLFGPYGGTRFTFTGSTGFFVYLDGRLLIELGRQQVTIEVGDEVEDVDASTFQRGGLDFTLGLGFRF